MEIRGLQIAGGAEPDTPVAPGSKFVDEVLTPKSLKAVKKGTLFSPVRFDPVPLEEGAAASAPTQHPAVSFVFDPKRDNRGTPYHDRGDQEMYTESALGKRQSLKNEPRILEEIQKFKGLYSVNEEGNISKAEYVRVHSRIAQQLIQGLSLEEAREIASEDFLSDTKGKDVLTPEDFVDSIFELADLWCNTLDVEEYTGFLDVLRLRLQYAGGQHNTAAYDLLGMEPKTKKKGKKKKRRAKS